MLQPKSPNHKLIRSSIFLNYIHQSVNAISQTF